MLVIFINDFIYLYSSDCKTVEQKYIKDGSSDRILDEHDLPQDVNKWYSVIFKIIKAHLRYPALMIKIKSFKQCLQELT